VASNDTGGLWSASSSWCSTLAVVAVLGTQTSGCDGVRGNDATRSVPRSEAASTSDHIHTNSSAELGSAATETESESVRPRRHGFLDRRPAPPPPEPQVTGALPSEEVREILRRHLGTIRMCREGEGRYLRVTRHQFVTVRIIIGADGRVTQSLVEEMTVRDESVVDCVLSLVDEIEFSRPEDGQPVTVLWQIRFWATSRELPDG
jgi:hypothetical protein